ncbi:MAG: hypothetical protein FWE60_02445 [Oscillospiraceae bacterium]|nr:hypothetical protein [Oscillospiraceae bacterium]
MNLEQEEIAFNRVTDGVKEEFAKITREFNISGLELFLHNNIEYRIKYNKDLPVDVFDLRVSIVEDKNGLAKIESADLVLMTEKLKAYIRHNEGLSIKLRNKFRFIMRFEIGHYLYFRHFEEKQATYEEFEAAMEKYEADLWDFNELVRISDFSTRERITKYYELGFNAWAAAKVGLAAETMIEFDNNIIIP